MRQKKHYVSLFILILLQLLICADSYSQTWRKYYRNSNYYIEDKGYDICESSDGYFFIVGPHRGPYPEMYSVVYKINKYGDTLWRRQYLDTTNGVWDMEALACAPTNDGGCVISGYINDGFPYAFKISSSGILQWSRRYYDQNIGGRALQIVSSPDNGFFICADYYICKIDSVGNLFWKKDCLDLGCPYGFYSVVNAFGGGYVCIGYDIDQQLSELIFKITKLDEGGNQMWQKSYPQSVMHHYPNIIRRLSDKYVLFTVESIGLYYIAKIDTVGTFLSQNSAIYDTLHTHYYSRGANAINDNRYVFAVRSYTDYIPDTLQHCDLRILDSTGSEIHSVSVNNNREGYFQINAITISSDGYIMCAGMGKEIYPMFDKVLAIRADTTLYIDPTKITEISNSIPKKFTLYQNYPNPFNSLTNIQFDIQQSGIYQLNVFNLLGQKTDEVFNKHFSPGSYKINYDMNRFSSGVYYYVLSSENMKQSKPLILLK